MEEKTTNQFIVKTWRWLTIKLKVDTKYDHVKTKTTIKSVQYACEYVGKI